MCFHVKLRSGPVDTCKQEGDHFRVIGRLLVGILARVKRSEACEGLIYIAGFRQAWKDSWDP